MEFAAAFLVHLVPIFYVGFWAWSSLMSDPYSWIRLHDMEIHPFACGFATWCTYKLSLYAPTYDLSIYILAMCILTGVMVMNWYLHLPRFWVRMR